jgi:hypothetical protein
VLIARQGRGPKHHPVTVVDPTDLSSPSLGPRATDPSAPVFFLSYSRPPGSTSGPDSRVRRLFDDLTRHLSELLAFPAGQSIGFLDPTIESGVKWRRQLLHAVGTCQVFVPLLTPRYFGSEWAAMEWDAFTRRSVTSRTGTAPASVVVPVTWVPTGPTEVPAAVRRYQRFRPGQSGESAEMYEVEGLYGLMVMSFEDVYHFVTWKLAQHIARVVSTCFVEPDVPADTNGLRRSFDSP